MKKSDGINERQLVVSRRTLLLINPTQSFGKWRVRVHTLISDGRQDMPDRPWFRPCSVRRGRR